MLRRILVTLPLPPAEQDYLRGALPDNEFRFVPAASATDDDLAWATTIFGNVAPARRLVPCTNLRWLHTPNVGLEAYAELPARRPDLRLTRAQGVNDDAVAEHAIAMLLFLTRGLDLLAEARLGRAWERQAYMNRGATVLAGKSAHVLGYGGIARCLVDKLLGLKMRVSIYRREARGDDPRVERFIELSALAVAIGDADAVLCVLPDHAETRGLISADVLERMKPSARLVNVGRGSVLDEQALARLLAERRLAGAALDVFEHEPLPPGSPLWDLPNVLISPHVAGRFDRELRGHCELFVYLASRP